MKNKIYAYTFGALALLGLTACATPQNASLAIQRENNQYQVTGMGKDKLTAQNNAVRAAQKTCPRNTSAIVTNEASKYNGVLDEQTGKVITQAGTLAGAVLGRSVNLSQDTDYNVTLDFSCR